MKRTRLICLILIMGMLFALTACGSKEKPVAAVEPEVTIRIAGSWTDCPALEATAVAFKEAYPNCTVIYEYLQGEYTNVLKERMQAEGDDRVDLFFTTSNIQAGHDLENSALDLASCEGLDVSGTFPSLVENYRYIEADGSKATKLYSVPLGAQMRGLFINLSLLKEVGVDKAPTNQAELLAACAALKKAGYIPFHGAPGPFAQQLLYPWICNLIANAEQYEETYRMVNARDPAATELFREVYEFMYALIENGYYDYHVSLENEGWCKDSTSDGYARSLLNITAVLNEKGEKTGEYQKGEGAGRVAFIPSALSFVSAMDKTKEDYHSDIEYAFVPAPVGENGGFVYLSPADAIGISKDTEKREWAVRFVNFLFEPKNNEAFAEIFHVIPNTKDAFDYVRNLYDIPTGNISELGQATFDWRFYRVLTRSTDDPADTRALPAISRANHPDNLNPETGSIYPFRHFWEQFQTEFVTLE